MLNEHIYLFQVLFFPPLYLVGITYHAKKHKNEKCFENQNVDQNKLFIF
jgi:hypothetical protein